MVIDYAAADRFMRRAIRHFSFTERDILVIDLVRENSFEQGRPVAVIPEQKMITSLTGIAEKHLKPILLRLQKYKVLQRDGPQFRLLIDSKFWKVRPRFNMTPETEALERWLNELTPEGEWFPPPEVEMDAALQQTALENLPTRGADGGAVRPNRSRPAVDPRQGQTGGVVSRESVGSVADDQPKPADEASPRRPAPVELAAVPFLGTAPVPEKGSDAPEYPKRVLAPNAGVATGSSAKVPEMGTPLKTLRASAVKSFKTAENFKALKPLSEEQRDLLRQVEAVVGKTTWANWGGAWTNVVKQKPELVQSILGEFRFAVGQGKEFKNPGGWMWDLKKRWDR
jgi:hypothetical protein